MTSRTEPLSNTFRSAPETDTSLALRNWHTLRVVAPAALSRGDVAAWQALRATHDDYRSHLLGPDFAIAVSEADASAQILLIERDTALVGVLPVTRRRGGFARPIGAPFCDYSGPILAKDFDTDLGEALGAAGVSAFRMSATPDPYGHLAKWAEHEDIGYAWTSAHETSGEALLETLRAENPKAHKNFRRLRNKLEKLGHTVTLEAGPVATEDRHALFQRKSLQYRETGKLDVLSIPAARHLLETVLDHPSCGAGWGAILKIDGSIAAGEFGPRIGDSFHPWIAVYDPAFHEYGPGNQLMRELVLQAPELGVAFYDLATGHGQYKKYFSTREVRVVSGLITAPSLAGRWQALREGMVRQAERGPLKGPVGKLRRRFDHIAACDPHASKRVRHVVDAFIHRGGPAA